MRILFIYPDVSTDIMNFCPAIHVLSAVMKREGFEVHMLHINNNGGIPYDKERIIIEAHGMFDIFAFTATTFNFKYANEIARWLKILYPHTLRVLGGSHATIQPESFDESNFDVYCVGEGEQPMVELAHALQNGLDWTKIPNLISKYGVNPVRGFLRDLDSLPFWDFDITDTATILQKRQGWLSISFSRGCSFECTFCINHLYKKIEIGKNDKMADYLRRRSAKNAIDELESLAKRFPIKFFNIDDDLLTMNKKWMREFTDGYKERIYKFYGIKYVINARATTLTEEIVTMLAESGCKEARIGFETGNEYLRNTLMLKNISNKSLEDAFSMLRKHDVMSVAFAMMGVPGETWDTFFDTVDMIVKLQPSLIRMTFLFPYKHTAIYDYCILHDLFKENYTTDNNRDYKSPLKFPSLTDEELFCFRFLLPWFVNYAWFNDDRYLLAIGDYGNMKYDELLTCLPDIIGYDKELSKGTKVPHYRFFSNNEYYFELYAPVNS